MSEFSNKVSVTIDGSTFVFWKSIQLMRTIDAQWTAELKATFEPNDEEFRQRFRPFNYQPFNVAINDEPVFTGTIVPCVPELKPKATLITTGAYSLPGVLGDCPVPPGALPSLEFRNTNLHDIAKALVKPFEGIVVVSDVPPGPVFKKVKIKSEQKVMSFLTKLAKTRGQLISTNKTGELVFLQAVDRGDPVAILEQGSSPLKSIVPTFNFSEYYSDITGIQPVRVRAKKSNQYTETNTLLSGVVRPFVFKSDQSRDGDLQTAVKWKLGRMFGNMVTYQITVATWRDMNNRYWEPNTMIRILAPGAMIYKYYNFLIKDVAMNKDAKSETASLTVCLPGSFTGNPPGSLPWDR